MSGVTKCVIFNKDGVPKAMVDSCYVVGNDAFVNENDGTITRKDNGYDFTHVDFILGVSIIFQAGDIVVLTAETVHTAALSSALKHPRIKSVREKHAVKDQPTINEKE